MERDELYHLKATITMLGARVGGLEYEVRVRDIRIEELSKENALLRKRLEEQKPSPPTPPPWVKPSVPPGRGNRLPFRQVTQLLGDVANLKLCAGAVSRQIRRLAKWFKGEHRQLALRLRKSDAVHADETGWRTNGRNGWLWTICDPRHTL